MIDVRSMMWYYTEEERLIFFTGSDNAVSWLPTIIIAGYNFFATFVVLWYYDPVMAMIAGTIADNLRMVKEDATDEEIIEALKTACAWDFIKKMKDGINSSVKERGKGLSEGQAQRVAIARAILRDAPVLLPDEATSALDVATERKVLKNIIKNHPNKTCIVTTHRPSVLHMCERVYRVMETKVTELTEEESARMAMDF